MTTPLCSCGVNRMWIRAPSHHHRDCAIVRATYSECPGCGVEPPEDTIWVAHGKFYCSEKCVRDSGVLR